MAWSPPAGSANDVVAQCTQGAPPTIRSMSRSTLAHLALAVAALLFGVTFVVVKEAIEILPPLAFVGWRFVIGSAALLAVARPRDRHVWRDGALAGVFLFAGYAFQTAGLETTTAANSGLITGLYVVFTPLVAALYHRRRPRAATVAGTAASFGGLALLTVGDGFALQAGDGLTVACAVAFAIHIVILSRLARRHSVVAFTAVQLLVTALLGVATSVAEGFPLPSLEVAPALITTGLFVSGLAFLIQVWSQTIIGPTRTAILLSLEPAFAAGAAALLLGERLSLRGWLGAALILMAIYLVVTLGGDESGELPAAEAVTPAH